jgi:hypothetical protein
MSIEATLIDLLEVLAAPDRSVDWELHLLDGLWGVGMYGSHPAYTESIDAALKLAPDGWKAILYTETRVAELYPKKGVKRPAGSQARGNGSTLPMAICIAALRARAHTLTSA